ncbi:hypothetical protein TRVL_02052 [Trypanosoma vivax]|uniref:SAM-dependent methyltransferase TRM5/TYW2-type domain-containing protein n=1 Tax=Trypanosoma vivax (strain Y486) TaxID=1055687 RepID=G0U5V2_TRYVY|nr:hypothetical protein TRVL_02052 [Trypanosoma vivax]CCC51253.1 conserved hypothetical protein [Trypanosoma vivax Y486]
MAMGRRDHFTRIFGVLLVICLLWFVQRYLPHLRRLLVRKLSRLKLLMGICTGMGPSKRQRRKYDIFVRKLREGGCAKDDTEIEKLFPRHFERIGHVVIVKLNNTVSLNEFAQCAKAFAQSFYPRAVSVVLVDLHGIAGELREPQLKIVWSADPLSIMEPKDSLKYALRQKAMDSVLTENDARKFEICTNSKTFATHVENGIRYSFDVCQAMFCSGNGVERMHFANIVAKDEVVVDMFSGIGYFTLPLAVHGCVKIIHALEKNENSAVYLKFNALQNRVSHLINVLHGDNREVGSELCGQCNRVIMGYLPSCSHFLHRALSFLRLSISGKPVGTIHYHFVAPKNHARQVLEEQIKSALGDIVFHSLRVADIRNVKSYAPKQFHFVADLVFPSV